MKRSAKVSTILLAAIAFLALFTCVTTAPANAQAAATSTTAALSVDTGSVLYGKTALFCGDSITAGMANVPEEERGWPGRIAAHYGMTVTNNGIPGASLSTARKSRIIAEIEKVRDKTYDYVIFQGMAGDALMSAPVGTMADSFDVADFDISTYAGGLEELFYYARQYFGDETHIGYIINYQTPKTEMGGRMTDMSEYVAAAIPICKKWGIPYLDLYDDAHLNNDLLKVTTKEYLLDYLHPNDAGYDILYKPIATWMETMGTGTGSVTESGRDHTLYWIIGGVAAVVVLAAGGTALFMVRRSRVKV
ncbi:MAG: SGNH/GDSL hydrolase family protein [Thermoleophilia bacterium]|nr:SGNH/GDSL hydrolase family protein [Thermoleophilia bacterium]